MSMLKQMVNQLALESQEVVADLPAVIEEPEVQEGTVTEEEVETVVDVTQSLESLALSMRSAEGGYNPRELALHDAAVEAQCKRLKLQPPLRPSLESIDAHGAEAETQLVLESLESYVEKLQDVALEASGSFVLSLSQEGFGESVAKHLRKLFAYIKAYAMKAYNWFASKLMKKHNRDKIDSYNAIFSRNGLSATSTPEEMAAAIKKSVADSGYMTEIKDYLEYLLNVMSRRKLDTDTHSVFFEVIAKLRKLEEIYEKIGRDDFALKYCNGNNEFTAGRITDQFVSARFLCNRYAHAVSMAMSAAKATEGEVHGEKFNYVRFMDQRFELLRMVEQQVGVVKQAIDNHNSQSYDKNEELLLSQMELAEKIQKFIKSFEGRWPESVKKLSDYTKLLDQMHDFGRDLAGALQTIGELRVKEDTSHGPGAERKSFQLVNYALNGIRESIAIVQGSARSVNAYIEHLMPIAEILEKLEKGV